MHVTLDVAITHGGTSAWAWIASGPPVIERARHLSEWMAGARTIRDRARSVGWRTALRQATRPPSLTGSTVAYPPWAARHAPTEARLNAERLEAATWTPPPRVSLVTPAFNTQPDWLRECYASLVAQSFPHWQWCVADDASTHPETTAALAELSSDPRVVVTRLPTNVGISAASNAALASATGDIIVLLDHDDTLPPQALFAVVSTFRAHPEVELLYSDEDKREIDGIPSDPYFKPDWSPELFLSTMYTCHLTAVRRALIERVGGFRTGFDGAQDYDLWLRMTEVTPTVHHIPEVLYHWRKVPGSTATSQSAKPTATDAGLRAVASAIARRGIAATVEPGRRPGHYRVRYRHPDSLTSVLMPTYGAAVATPAHVSRVVQAVTSMCATTRPGQIEFIFATDDGTVPEAVRVAAGTTPVTVVAVPGPFNFSARINAGARAASGPVLLLANDDLDATDPDWLDALREYALLPDVGAVGPRLDLPDGRVQHAGLLLGVRGIAAHAFHHAAPATEGYFGSLISPRNMSAVSGACLMTRADVFARVGGMDLRLPVDFNDVDYCLRVQATGLRVVFTPFARLVHHESASLGSRVPGADAVQVMQDRWQSVCDRDPYYNRNLSKDAVDYRLA